MKATELMRENLVRRLPVVDENQTIQGMVSMVDLLRRAEPDTTQAHETLKKISDPSLEPSKPRGRSRRRTAA
jgi:CBS-domain-containing membrane protein